MQEEVLKQVRETELCKHVARWLAFEGSCCEDMISLYDRDTLPETFVNICCQGAQLLTGKAASLDGFCCKGTNLKLIKSDDEKPATVVSGTVVTDGIREKVDVLVPSSQTEPRCNCNTDPSSCIWMHPSACDVLTVLVLALPESTWSGIKEEKLREQIKTLASTDSLPSLLQEEVNAYSANHPGLSCHSSCSFSLSNQHFLFPF